MSRWQPGVHSAFRGVLVSFQFSCLLLQGLFIVAMPRYQLTGLLDAEAVLAG